MKRLTDINIKVWQTQESITTVVGLHEAIDKAEADADLDDAIEEVLEEKLLEAGFDTEKNGIYFTFDFS